MTGSVLVSAALRCCVGLSTAFALCHSSVSPHSQTQRGVRAEAPRIDRGLRVFGRIFLNGAAAVCTGLAVFPRFLPHTRFCRALCAASCSRCAFACCCRLCLSRFLATAAYLAGDRGGLDEMVPISSSMRIPYLWRVGTRPTPVFAVSPQSLHAVWRTPLPSVRPVHLPAQRL